MTTAAVFARVSHKTASSAATYPPPPVFDRPRFRRVVRRPFLRCDTTGNNRAGTGINGTPRNSFEKNRRTVRRRIRAHYYVRADKSHGRTLSYVISNSSVHVRICRRGKSRGQKTLLRSKGRDRNEKTIHRTFETVGMS